jgi:hypothetical protein
MHRIERWLWTVVYFAIGGGLLAAVWRAVSIHELQAIPPYAIAFFWVGLWRRFKREIVRDLGWGARSAIMSIRVRINPALWYMIRGKTPPAEIHGLTVYVAAASDEQRASQMNRVEAALDDIRDIWPSRYQRLRRLRPILYVGWVRAGGAYIYGTNVIILNETIVGKWQSESVAVVICHELSHMYVAQRGVRLTPWADTRLERIADLEMRLWGLRMLAQNRTGPQSILELRTILRESRRRWWWRRDGTRVHGLEWEGSPQ